VSPIDPNPPRLRSGDAALSAEERAVGALLDEASRIAPWPPAQQSLFLRRFDAAPPTPRRWAWAALAAGVVGILAAGAWLRARPSPALTFESAQLSPAADARYRLDAAAHVLILDRGQLEVRAAAPVQIQTPQLRVTVAHGRVRVDALTDVTQIIVLQGRVRVIGRAGHAVSLTAGERLRSDDPRLAAPTEPAAPAAAPPLDVGTRAPPIRACDGAGVDRAACLADEARGAGLAAQNALFALALHARDQRRWADALSACRAAQQRFPDGVFAPEVSLEAIDMLTALHREAEALDETQHFLAAFGDDARASKVKAAQAGLRRALQAHGAAAPPSPEP